MDLRSQRWSVGHSDGANGVLKGAKTWGGEVSGESGFPEPWTLNPNEPPSSQSSPTPPLVAARPALLDGSLAPWRITPGEEATPTGTLPAPDLSSTAGPMINDDKLKRPKNGKTLLISIRKKNNVVTLMSTG